MTDNNTLETVETPEVLSPQQYEDKNITITLPVSKYKVTLRKRIFYQEYKALDAVMLKHTRGVMKDGEMSQEFDATAHQLYQRKMIETFIVKCENPTNGELIQINVLLDKEFDIADGLLLEDTVADLYEALKKSLQQK